VRTPPPPGARVDATPDFTRRIISVALLVRLAAIMVALLGMVGDTMTAPVLACVLAMSGTSLACLLNPATMDFTVRHPLAVVCDVLVTLGVLAVLGVESPMVLATFPTALCLGVLFPRRTSAVATVVLVAGYVLVADRAPDVERGFMVSLGVPTLYLCLTAVGAAIRSAHAQQVEVGRELARVREAAAAADERARLAREMHDSLGKTLHGIALGAQALPLWVARDPEAAVRHAEGLAAGAQQASDEARQLLVRMRADQSDRPLVEVLHDECARWQAAHGVPCEVESTGVADLPASIRYELLAILGEALENVRRHADAGLVRVTLTGEAGGAVVLRVQDDGRGFVPRPDGGSPRGHFGLTGLHERAREIGASVLIQSIPGRGTRVTVRHPAEEVAHASP